MAHPEDFKLVGIGPQMFFTVHTLMGSTAQRGLGATV